MHNERLTKLAQELRRLGLDAAAVLPSANLFYLTGMSATLSERPLVFVVTAQGEMAAVAPSFEAERVRRDSGVTQVFTYTDEEGPRAGFAKLAQGCGVLRRLGMEYQAARLLEYKLLESACGVEECVDLRPIMAAQRMCKDATELDKLQRAATMADRAMAVVERELQIGVTETAIVEAVEAFVKGQGGKMSFITVIGGERTALPHASTSNRPLQRGDAVIADLGCVVEGYTSDITRTFFLAGVPAELVKIGAVVAAANQLAREAIREGVAAGHLDTVARQCIVDSGYGAFFTHRTGHGLGIEVHEEPYIVGGSGEKLQVGNVFTIEPGVYVPGLGGVRIEDDVCVTADGAKSLSAYPRAVRIVP